MKEFSKEIIKVLEDAGFNIGEITEQDGEYYIELSQYTPEGEDWYVIIWFDDTEEDFIKSVRTCSDNFDVDEEVEPYIEMRGQRGVPNSISALLEDAKWKEKTLEDLADNLEDITDTEPWKVFYYGLKELGAYTMFGEGAGEEQATKELLASELKVKPSDIEVKLEMR